MMGFSAREALLICGSLSLCMTFFIIGLSLIQKSAKPMNVHKLRKTWERLMGQGRDEKWERLLRAAGYPFGWGGLEWVSLQWLCGFMPFLIILFITAVRGGQFSLISMIIIPVLGYFLPLFMLKWWIGYREEILSLDIARFINRYVNLLENRVPPYQAMVKAARPTRLLKQYIPSLPDWNQNRLEALETMKQRLGIDDGIILISNIRTIEQLTEDQAGFTMQRLEWTVDNRRTYRHRKKIKSLGIAYSVIVYPAFYIGLIVAMFPWYKLLTEILEKYLV